MTTTRRRSYYLPRDLRDRFHPLGPLATVAARAAALPPPSGPEVTAARAMIKASPFPGKEITVSLPADLTPPANSPSLLAALLAYEATNPAPLPAVGRPPTDTRRIYLPDCPRHLRAPEIRATIAAAIADPDAYPPAPILPRGRRPRARGPARTLPVTEAEHAFLVAHVGEGSIGRSVVAWATLGDHPDLVGRPVVRYSDASPVGRLATAEDAARQAQAGDGAFRCPVTGESVFISR